MSVFFSGAVTSSPIKRRSGVEPSSQSPDASLLSPDSSYVCYSSAEGGAPCCCRRSPRLLTNGYYAVTEDSFIWDDEGNVSLTPCKTNVSYKENLVRVFRRRRRPRGALARLLSDVTETCQTWLGEKVFRGVFGTRQNLDQDLDQDLNQDLDQDPDSKYVRGHDWSKSGQQGAELTTLDGAWSGLNSSIEADDGRAFTYDPTEAPPSPDKVSPPPTPLIQEEICSETCQSKELGGLSEVPPPSPLYTNACCCQASAGHTGLTLKTFLLLIFTVFIVTALITRCLWWSTTLASTVSMATTTYMILTKAGPMGEWRRAKTEDITSRNE